LPKANLSKEMQGLDRPGSTIIKDDFEPRRKSLPLPAEVNQKSTWLLGYIAKNKAEREITMYAAMAVVLGREKDGTFLEGKSAPVRGLYAQMSNRLRSTEEWKRLHPNFDEVKQQIDRIQDEIRESRRRGWLNTSHYLALDYMDVYVATSMRERWEFEDVHTISNEIFSQPVLRDLNLRYFDPTQSFLENRVDKGIVEALMLKRARCTIYMAQETDTFGKDSELATTLAQGKPVIVFVPEIKVEEHATLALLRPIAYLQRRLPQLLAEEKISSAYIGEVLEF